MLPFSEPRYGDADRPESIGILKMVGSPTQYDFIDIVLCFEIRGTGCPAPYASSYAHT